MVFKHEIHKHYHNYYEFLGFKIWDKILQVTLQWQLLILSQMSMILLPHVILCLMFQVLPIIIFFSSVISLCYYVGIMQLIIKKIAWLMQITMKTSGVESLNAAGNIFIGQVHT